MRAHSVSVHFFHSANVPSVFAANLQVGSSAEIALKMSQKQQMVPNGSAVTYNAIDDISMAGRMDLL